MKLTKHTNPDGTIVTIFVGNGANIGNYTNIGNYAKIGDDAIISNDAVDYLHFQQKYTIDLYKVVKNEWIFRYGCETHKLKDWTPKLVNMLLKKHDLQAKPFLNRALRTVKAFIK